MLEYSRDEIEAAYHAYATRVGALRKEAEDSVAEWSCFDDWPIGLHPLFDEAAMYPDAWKPRKLKRGPKESLASWHEAGVDAAGRIRIVRSFRGQSRIYLYEQDRIDELFLRGDQLLALQRATLEGGVVRTLHDYRLSPHQTYVEKFEYASGRCVRSVQQSEYVSGGKWETAGWQTICDFEHDEQGLVSAYRDMGPRLGGRTLVFLRPAPKSKAKKVDRRPLVAYVVPAGHDGKGPDGEGPEHAVYSDVYGLEMTYDDEWPLDIVPFIPAEYVSILFDDTDVTSNGTVYGGALASPASPDFKAIAGTGAKWTQIDADEATASLQIAAAWAAGLNVLIVAEDDASLLKAIAGQDPPAPKGLRALVGSLLGKRKASAAERLAVALLPRRSVDPSGAQTAAKQVREALAAIGCAGSRIVLASGSLKAEPGEYLTLPDVDGLYFESGGFGSAVDAARQISLRRGAERGDG